MENIRDKLITTGYDVVVVDAIFSGIENKRNRPKRILGIFPRRKTKFEFAKDVPNPIQEPVKARETKEKINPHPEFVPNEYLPKVGINSKINELTERMNNLTGGLDDKKNKEFKIPHNIKSQLKDLAKKNKVMIILLKRNRSCEPFITEIKQGFVMINGVPHNASMDFIFLWKGKYPTMVVPEWDINPIGTMDYYEAVTGNRTADPIATVIRMIENKEILMKNPMNMKMLIWIGLGVAIVGYALFRRG